MTFIKLIGFLLVLAALVSAKPKVEGSEAARQECNSIHKTPVDGGDYLNYGCKLMCVIGGVIHYHELHESQHCPDLSRNVCRAGRCVEGGDAGLGYLDIKVVSGHLPDMDPIFYPKPDGYVIVCVQNDRGSRIERPLKDRSNCDCKTKVVDDNNDPVWNHDCSNWRTNLFANNSRVIFEAWDEDVDADDFIGSESITVPELLARRDSGRNVEYDILKTRDSGDEKHGKLTMNVIWTPARRATKRLTTSQP